MSNVEIGYWGIAVLLALIALRVPIGPALIGVSFGGIWMITGPKAAWGAVGIIPWNFTATWQMSSIPMFLMMGFVCFHAGLTKGLFEAARLWLSRLPGGMAIAAVFGAAGFAAVTGSSIACAAAMGRIAVPEMMRQRYDAAFATGTVAAAGTIGALIPPSILLILYGIIAQVPVGSLFMGGVGAGLLTALGYCVMIVVRVKMNPGLAPPVNERSTAAERLSALLDTWPVLLLMTGVLGGLFFGIFTPTEAGAAGAALAVLVGLIKRSLSLRGFWSSVVETLQTTAALFIIAIGANMLTRFMAISGAGRDLASFVDAMNADPMLLLLGIAIIYLVLGMFLEPIGAMLLTLPILLPVLKTADIDLLWFGILLAKFLEIGMITPPIGLNVFVIKSVVGDLVTTGQIFYGILWFLVADLIVVALLIAFPDIILWLPTVMK
ncbi:TRAP transporter large permease [Seohaeicola zhoushanensis]|uniref:TRAP transporter large permease protein n=1 Tax=Seohaeicola zhoushanensis TaxID=1569283 RepID=A0A8J3MA85_9RHOB|nr:TRAP transporter large permease [Seohaeicola zhoushanensis]GHF67362.1 C4-dicarboxylate ABC transporter [Seohaeicola zhoushanensis]